MGEAESSHCEDDFEQDDNQEEEEEDYEEETMVVQLSGILDVETVRKAAKEGRVVLRRSATDDPLVQVNSLTA